MSTRPVKLDPWVMSLVVDPLSKEPLSVDERDGSLCSPYGRRYPRTKGILDLRLLNNETTPDQQRWKAGQRWYESWAAGVTGEDAPHSDEEIRAVEAVYREIPVEGRCLDVGGHQGRLRRFLSRGQEYVSCDPFLDCFEGLDRQPRLLATYPVLRDPVNFLCCDAEFLPFASSAFDTVHMRSVIDHFLSPELALNEAYRVLRNGGTLLVGLFVEGGRRGRLTWPAAAKKVARETLSTLGVERYADYHVWHPTYDQLVRLISQCGFRVEKSVWQAGTGDSVCYIRARKFHGLQRGRST